MFQTNTDSGSNIFEIIEKSVKNGNLSPQTTKFETTLLYSYPSRMFFFDRNKEIYLKNIKDLDALLKMIYKSPLTFFNVVGSETSCCTGLDCGNGGSVANYLF